MKTITQFTLRCSLALTAFGTLLTSCERSNSNTAPSAAQKAEVETIRAQAAADKLAAQTLRDEAERLRAEAALRQQIVKLAETPVAPEPLAKPTTDQTSAPAPGPAPEITAAPTPTPTPTIATAAALTTTQPYVRDDDAYEPFYNDLQQDGSWLESPDYGYVWQPNLGTETEWAPYTNGTWSYTDYGWAWESPERFSHICYHYGRWTRLRGCGWVWVPGREWAPAWVSWRSNDECIGWAPLPPAARWHHGLGIHTWADGVYHLQPSHYVFVTLQNLCHPSCREVFLPKQRCEQLFLESKNITKLTPFRTEGRSVFVKNEGPSLETLKPKLGEHFRERKIQFADRADAKARIQPAKDDQHLVMGQWAFRENTKEAAGSHAKPPVIKQKLERGLDVQEEISPTHKAAVQRKLVTEASQSLREQPARSQPLPSAIVPETPPKAASNLPPVQRRLEPYQKPTDNPPARISTETADSRVRQETADRQQRALAQQQKLLNATRQQQSEAAQSQQEQNEKLAQLQKQQTALAQQQQEAARKQQEAVARQGRDLSREKVLHDTQMQEQADQQREAAQRLAKNQKDQLNQLQQQQVQALRQKALAEQQQETLRKQQEALARQERDRSREKVLHETQLKEQVAQQREVAQRQAQHAETTQRENQQAAMRKQQEDQAQQLAQQASLRKQQEAQSQRQAQQDAMRKQQEDQAQHQAQQEALRRKQEDQAQRQAQQEAMRRQQDQQAQAQRQAQQEASRKQEESNRKQQEESSKRQQESNKPRASGR